MCRGLSIELSLDHDAPRLMADLGRLASIEKRQILEMLGAQALFWKYRPYAIGRRQMRDKGATFLAPATAPPTVRKSVYSFANIL